MFVLLLLLCKIFIFLGGIYVLRFLNVKIIYFKDFELKINRFYILFLKVSK